MVLQSMLDEDVEVGQTIQLSATWDEGIEEGDPQTAVQEREITCLNILKLWLVILMIYAFFKTKMFYSKRYGLGEIP